MVLYKTKYNILVKTIAMAVVCLFTFNTISWAYPDSIRSAIKRNTLAVQSIFKPLSDEGIETSAELEFELLAGIRLLLAVKSITVVNGFLAEMYKNSPPEETQKIKFLEIVKTDGKNITARFNVLGKDGIVFEIEYLDTVTDKGSGDKSVEDARLATADPSKMLQYTDVFQKNDVIRIKKVSSEEHVVKSSPVSPMEVAIDVAKFKDLGGPGADLNVTNPFPLLSPTDQYTVRQLLKEAFRGKYSMRNILLGGPIRQPGFFAPIERDQDTITRMRNRYAQVDDNSYNPVFADPGDVKNIKDIISGVLSGKITLPLVFKPEHRAHLARVLFIEKDVQSNIKLTMAYDGDKGFWFSDTTNAVRDYCSEKGIKNISIDDDNKAMQVILESGSLDLSETLYDIWRIFSANWGKEDYGLYDAGMVESFIPMTKYNGKCFETRHRFEGNLSSGAIKLKKENDGNRRLDSLLGPGGWYAKLSSSSYFSYGSTNLLWPDMFNPIYEMFAIPEPERREFRQYVDELVEAEFRYLTMRVKAAGIDVDMEIKGQFDLVWLPPSAGDKFPTPVIIEAEVTSINTDYDGILIPNAPPLVLTKPDVSVKEITAPQEAVTTGKEQGLPVASDMAEADSIALGQAVRQYEAKVNSILPQWEESAILGDDDLVAGLERALVSAYDELMKAINGILERYSSEKPGYIYPCIGPDLIPLRAGRTFSINKGPNDFQYGLKIIGRVFGPGAEEIIQNDVEGSSKQILDALDIHSYDIAASGIGNGTRTLIIKGFGRALDEQGFDKIRNVLAYIFEDVLREGDRVLILDKNDVKFVQLAYRAGFSLIGSQTVSLFGEKDIYTEEEGKVLQLPSAVVMLEKRLKPQLAEHRENVKDTVEGIAKPADIVRQDTEARRGARTGGVLNGKLLDNEHVGEHTLMMEAKKYLKNIPVNELIDLSVIPRRIDRLTPQEAGAQLDENLETLARMIAWHNSLGLDIRYGVVYEHDEKYEMDAVRRLKAKLERIAALPGMNLDVEKVFTLHTGPDTLEVQLKDVASIRAMDSKNLHEKTFPIGLSRDKEGIGACLPNYTGASAIGLSLAALYVAHKKETADVYKAKLVKALNKIRSIYELYGIDTKDLTVDVVDMLVTFSAKARIDIIIKFALPPIVKAAIETLNEYHRAMQLLLQSA